MEKRTILALVLSFVVLFVWMTLFQPSPNQEPVGGEENAKGESAVVAPLPLSEPVTSLPAAQDQPAQIPPPVAPKAVEKKEIFVETPLYKAVFSNEGATIKSFQLKKYRLTTAPDSPLVELSGLEGTREGMLEMTFGNPEKSASRRIIYHSEQDFLNLSEGAPPQDIIFSALTPEGVTIKQTLRIHADRYPIDLTIDLINSGPAEANGNLMGFIRNLPPEEKSSYYAFSGLALLLNNELEEIAPKKMAKTGILSGQIDWVAYEDGHFMSAIIPGDQAKGSFQGQFLPTGIVTGTYLSPPLSIMSQEHISRKFTIYMGPRDLSILKTLDRKLDRAVNFGWFDVIAKPLLYTLRFFYKYVGNYGLAIIILTVLIKILFWPLTHKSYKSMKEMQKLQPHMAKLREKYKDNKEQLNKELMSLYKTYKVNPVGGCLPMIIQIPVFFALFRILGNSIELRHAPFILWINDLSAPDRLFHFPFSIPFMSPPYGIPILTLLMGASMFIQQKMTPTPGDPTQAKIMLFLPVIFTVMFVNFPSGLVLYWLVNNILSIGQQYRIIKSS
ncbi:MAG: membrane protein insertase YidC [Desulfatiglandales bacterium]